MTDDPARAGLIANLTLGYLRHVQRLPPFLHRLQLGQVVGDPPDRRRRLLGVTAVEALLPGYVQRRSAADRLRAVEAGPSKRALSAVETRLPAQVAGGPAPLPDAVVRSNLRLLAELAQRVRQQRGPHLVPLNLPQPRLLVRDQKRSQSDELGETPLRRESHLASRRPSVLPVQDVRVLLGVRLRLRDLRGALDELGDLLGARPVGRDGLQELPGHGGFVRIRVQRRGADAVGTQRRAEELRDVAHRAGRHLRPAQLHHEHAEPEALVTPDVHRAGVARRQAHLRGIVQKLVGADRRGRPGRTPGFDLVVRVGLVVVVVAVLVVGFDRLGAVLGAVLVVLSGRPAIAHGGRARGAPAPFCHAHPLAAAHPLVDADPLAAVPSRRSLGRHGGSGGSQRHVPLRRDHQPARQHVPEHHAALVLPRQQRRAFPDDVQGIALVHDLSPRVLVVEPLP